MTVLVEKENDLLQLKTEERTRCEVWTRVMGYHRPVSEFNTGKKGEYDERTCFKEPGTTGGATR